MMTAREHKSCILKDLQAANAEHSLPRSFFKLGGNIMAIVIIYIIGVLKSNCMFSG